MECIGWNFHKRHYWTMYILLPKQLSHWILRKFITNKLTYLVLAWYHSINIHIHSKQLLTHGITLVTSPHRLSCITELLLRQTALPNSFNGPQNFNNIVSTTVGICNALISFDETMLQHIIVIHYIKTFLRCFIAFWNGC